MTGEFGEVEFNMGLPDDVASVISAIQRLQDPEFGKSLLCNNTVELLQPCYELSWWMLKKPSLFDLIVQKVRFERAPSRTHFWLMPINGAVRPKNLAEQQQVSDLGYYLHYGLLMDILPGDFVQFAREKGITACIDGVRASHRKIRLAELQDETPLTLAIESRGRRDGGYSLSSGDTPSRTDDPEDPADDADSEDGVRIAVKMYRRKGTLTRSVFLTIDAADKLEQFILDNEKPDGLDFAYAMADAIENLAIEEIYERFGAALARNEGR